MDKGINNNGFEYVDLELPSGTLWATYNVGASKPSESGLYFQWGDTKGYTAEQVGKDKHFALDFSDYKWGVYPNFTKYATTDATLDLEDDAAHANMGGSWHIPTPEQIMELLDNTTRKLTTLDGVNGSLFTSKKNPSKSIFIPTAGYASGGSVHYGESISDVWTSMLGKGGVVYGTCLGLVSGGVFLGGYANRYYGFSVRGVIG